MKWTCERCKRRNDSPLFLPLSPREFFSCKFCHRMTAILFTPKANGEKCAHGVDLEKTCNECDALLEKAEEIAEEEGELEQEGL